MVPAAFHLPHSHTGLLTVMAPKRKLVGKGPEGPAREMVKFLRAETLRQWRMALGGPTVAVQAAAPKKASRHRRENFGDALLSAASKMGALPEEAKQEPAATRRVKDEEAMTAQGQPRKGTTRVKDEPVIKEERSALDQASSFTPASKAARTAAAGEPKVKDEARVKTEPGPKLPSAAGQQCLHLDLPRSSIRHIVDLTLEFDDIASTPATSSAALAKTPRTTKRQRRPLATRAAPASAGRVTACKGVRPVAPRRRAAAPKPKSKPRPYKVSREAMAAVKHTFGSWVYDVRGPITRSRTRAAMAQGRTTA